MAVSILSPLTCTRERQDIHSSLAMYLQYSYFGEIAENQKTV